MFNFDSFTKKRRDDDADDPQQLTIVLSDPNWQGFADTSSGRLHDWDQAIMVSLVWDTPQLVKFAPRSSFAFDEWFPIALDNLKRRPGRPDWIGVDFEGHPVLARMGDEYTASDILDNAFLESARQRLEAEALFIGIPSRSVMVVGADPRVVGALVVTRMKEHESGERMLAPHIFAFAEGKRHFVGIPTIDGR